MFGVTASHDTYNRVNPSANTTANINRNILTGYLQDKIHFSDKFELTPGIRYLHASDYTVKEGDGADKSPSDSQVNHVSGMMATQYKFDDTTSL